MPRALLFNTEVFAGAVVRYPTTVPVADGQRRVSEIAEAIAFFLALLAYLWLLAIRLPWSGVLVLLAVAVSWRRRSLTPRSLGLGWDDFRASGQRWVVVWIVSASLFLILGYRSLFSLAALTHGAVYFAWAAAQQIVYLSMTYLPLRDNLKSRRLAAGLAGAAFSIMHFPNPILVPATFVWGVASSLLFERCRTVWGLALLQMMLSSTLFWITPRELNRNFRIGPYYYRLHSSQAPGGTFAPPMSIWIVSEWAVTTDRAIHTFAMAAPILTQDVTEHLEAAIQLSNRRVHLRFLDEAELLLAFNLPAAAVLVAGVVLESILAGLREHTGSGNRERMEKWFELRNSVAHAQAPTVTLDHAREMVEDVRRPLTREIQVGPRLAPPKVPAEAPRQVRGKYKFVPTSTAEFIRRKADELRLRWPTGSVPASLLIGTSSSLFLQPASARSNSFADAGDI